MKPSQPSLPANRAFVVQLHKDAKPAQGDVRGRVEHLVSSEADHFASRLGRFHAKPSRTGSKSCWHQHLCDLFTRIPPRKEAFSKRE